MLNETVPTSVQGVDGQAIGQVNPSNLVNGEIPQTGNTVQTNDHKGFVDRIIKLIANLTGNPDPFTGKANVSVTPVAEVKVEAQTQTTNPEFKAENQTSTAPVQNDEGGLFGKFTSTLGNIGNVVENMGEKALGSAVNVVNTGLEKAESVGTKVIDQAQAKVEETANKVNTTLNEVSKEEPQNNTQPVNPGPDYFFTMTNNVDNTDNKQ